MTERLLLSLRRRTNDRGLVLASEDDLRRELSASHEVLTAEIEKLDRSRLVEILAPLPFLVLRLRSWSGNASKPSHSRPIAYSYSKLSSNRLNESYRPAGDEALLREILETLGETDPKSFEGAIRNFAPEVIRKALDRVRRTRSLRKNRTALFRYLLTKLA